jgi:hypothetical protein
MRLKSSSTEELANKGRFASIMVRLSPDSDPNQHFLAGQCCRR